MTASGFPQPLDASTIARRISAIENAIKVLDGARRLAAATISPGDLRLREGGSILVYEGGGLQVYDGGSILVRDGGGLEVIGGGGVDVRDGGEIIAHSETGDGFARLRNGELSLTRTAVETPGRVWAAVGDTGRTTLFLAPPRTVGTTNPTRLSLEGPSVGNAGGAWIYSNAHIQLDATTNARMDAGNAIVIDSGAGTFIDAGSQATITSGTQTVVNSGSNILLNTGSGNHVFVDHTTTGNAANCFIATNGAIQRSTSSRRYKRDIEDLTVDPDVVLELRPRTWRDRLEVENDPDTETRHVGFIAEELDELGLDQFVIYDDDGPEAIAYDRLTAALIPTLRAQRDRLDDQAREIAELRETVATLAARVAPDEAPGAAL